MIDSSLLRPGPALNVQAISHRQSSSIPHSEWPAHVPVSRIQRLIAGRMLASKRCKPCFYMETKADVTDLMGMRHNLSKALGVKITSGSFLMHALSLAARQYPLMVGQFVWQDPQDPQAGAIIRVANSINVGFAVNSPQGLVVPVIRDAQNKALAVIAADEKVLTDRARANKLTLDDLEGQTIGLSNLGAYDVDSFIGIVPPLVSTLLAASKVNLAVVPREDRPVVRKVMSLTLTVDQRVIDAEYAARFLQFLVQQLSDPQHLI
jgi:pyruvate dehydrogenase E2 component (dihydrolipoamide acetyltransferase)